MNSFDDIMGVAMELDLFAGGDPTVSPALQKNNKNSDQTVSDPDENAGSLNTNKSGNDPNAQQNDDASPEDGDDDTDDDMGDDSEGGASISPDGPPPETQDELQRKINLRKLICALYSAFDSSIESMRQHDPPVDRDLSKRYYDLELKMVDAKNIIYTMAVTEISKSPYEDMLRKYAAMNELYTICVEYLNTILFPTPMKKKSKNK